MTPKMTGAMRDSAIEDGAEVSEKRKMQPLPPRPIPIVPQKEPELDALRAEISQLKQALADEKIASEKRNQELTALFSALSDNKPMRLKPIRDMNRESPTYLLVTHYDFVPVAYQRKLDS